MKNTSLFASFWAMPKGSGVWGEAPWTSSPAPLVSGRGGLGAAPPKWRDAARRVNSFSWSWRENVYIDFGNPPLGGRAHGRWVQAAAPSVLGGKSGFRRPPSTEGATDCAHFGWGRGGLCREVAPKRHFIFREVAPKRHLFPLSTGAMGVGMRYAWLSLAIIINAYRKFSASSKQQW